MLLVAASCRVRSNCGQVPAPPYDLNVATRTSTAKNSIAKSLLTMRHHPPNEDNPVAQISRLSPQSLHKEYERWCEGSREHPSQTASGAYFTPPRTNLKSSGVLPNKAVMLAMPSFVNSRRLLGFTEKSWVEDLKTKHVKRPGCMSKLHLKARILAATRCRSTQMVLLHMRTPFPRWRAAFPRACPSGTSNCKVWSLHGHALNLVNVFRGVKGSANMFLTTLLRTFQLLRKGLPRIVKLRMAACIDGSTARSDGCDLR